MHQLIMIEVVVYFGVILLQTFWAVRGELTEQRFAIFQVASLVLIMLTAGFDAYFSLPNPNLLGLVTGSIGPILFSIVGYPVARWIYRHFLAPKK